MSKLEDYYRLFDMFKGKLTDSQKEVLGQLEDQLISEEVLPAISKSVAPILSTLRRNLTIVVNYNPEGGITVKTTRGEVVVKEPAPKRYEIPSGHNVVKVADTSKDSYSNKFCLNRAPATGLCVRLPNGRYIQASKANMTMAEAVELAGAERVAKLLIPHDGEYLVSRLKHPKYSNAQFEMSNGYLLNTHSNTITKKRQLELISEALHLGWKVEIIK